MAIIYGVAPSPYVRKVMLAHAFKGIPYEFKMAFPGSDDEEFREGSPLGKVPAYRTDDGFAFSDSSVIIAYLEKTSTTNALYPSSPNDYARALWLEEYADTKMMDATAALYYQRVIGPKFFDHTTDDNRVDELQTELIPLVLDYVEEQLGESMWIMGDSVTNADISIGGNLINLHHADFHVNGSRWPKLSEYLSNFMSLDIVQSQLEIETAAFNQA